jgi:thermitase
MSLTGRRAASLVSLAILTASLSVFASLKQAEAVPGEYIVRLKAGKMFATSKAQLSQKLNAFVKSSIPSQNIIVVKRASFENRDSAVKSLAVNDIVDVVEPNYIYRIKKTPNDPMLDQTWGLKNVGQADSEGHAGVAGIDIDAEKAWDIETGSDKTIVAVIDTGIDFNHPDLKDNLWTNEAEANGKAGVDDDNNGVIDDIHGYNAIDGTGNAMDDQGHGSHCSGTIGAKGDDGKGIVGVNWNTRLMAVKFLSAEGSGTLEDALKAIDYATKMGAKVMSNSWGGGGLSQTLLDAIKRSNDAGAIFIAAAGNDASNNDDTPSYPASYDVPNIISVAAIDNTGTRADFSNYGKKTVHIGAPGVNVYSSTGGAYDSWSGTSMATPHVSGVAALVWSHEPQLTSAELKQRILLTARPLPGLKNKTSTGGMVNAYNALTNTTPPPDPNDPSNWATQDANYQSEMPYQPDTNTETEVSVPGVKEFALYFEKFDTESGYDTLKIYDSTGKLVDTMSGSNDEVFSMVITGDSAKLVFKSDSSVERGGWKITKIAYR